jgi:hypothetical protein
MACRSNEVEHGMDTIVPETRITLDSRLFGQDIVILSLQISDNLRKAAHGVSATRRHRKLLYHQPRFVVDLVSKPWGINDSQGDAGALLVKLEFCM